jgi:hypothetical protein
MGIGTPDLTLRITWSVGLLTGACTGEECADFGWLWANVVTDAERVCGVMAAYAINLDPQLVL